MSTVLRPVGPEPPRVYWVRRLIVLVAVVLVLALIGTVVRGWFAPGEAETPPGAAAEAAEADGGASTSPAACTPDELTVTATTAVRVHEAGESPQINVTVTNTGDAACTVDLGPAQVEVLITSGADRIWSSADCPAQDGKNRLLLLPPGDRETTDVLWPRERSAPECPDGLPEPRPGTYRAEVTVEGVTSEPTVFELR